MQIYTTPLNTTIFFTSKFYGGIKLVWIWILENFNMVKVIKVHKSYSKWNNNLCINDAQYQNPPFFYYYYFWYTPYTQTPFSTAKPINPPFYPFSDLFKPTLSEGCTAHYLYMVPEINWLGPNMANLMKTSLVLFLIPSYSVDFVVTSDSMKLITREKVAKVNWF